jgi:hypothetical protein
MVIPGQINLELLIGNPLLYYAFLLMASMVAGLLAGKQESDLAKSGDLQYKGKENTSIFDWLEDASYGLIGGILFLVVVQAVPGIPLELMVASGFAGRKTLINWGKKAEKVSEDTELKI